MVAVIVVGLHASGKSTFRLRRFFRTRLRINLDMLKTKHRERLLLDTCLPPWSGHMIPIRAHWVAS